MRLRLRYTKRGPARFTSHRDFSRALERSLRRAQIPMAYSSGFSPHPRISFAGAAPTSAASEAEYVELALSQICDPAKIANALNEVLPPGFVVLEAATASSKSLTELLTASRWRLELPGASKAVLARAVEELLGMSECLVERMTKKGLRTFDVRSAVLELTIDETGALQLFAKHQVPLVRPDDVVTALRRIAPELPETALATRTEQGCLEGMQLTDPLR